MMRKRLMHPLRGVWPKVNPPFFRPFGAALSSGFVPGACAPGYTPVPRWGTGGRRSYATPFGAPDAAGARDGVGRRRGTADSPGATAAQDLTTTEDGAYFLDGATSDGALIAVTAAPPRRPSS